MALEIWTVRFEQSLLKTRGASISRLQWINEFFASQSSTRAGHNKVSPTNMTTILQPVPNPICIIATSSAPFEIVSCICFDSTSTPQLSRKQLWPQQLLHSTHSSLLGHWSVHTKYQLACIFYFVFVLYKPHHECVLNLVSSFFLFVLTLVRTQTRLTLLALWSNRREHLARWQVYAVD